MKKTILTMMLTCSMTMNVDAQVYAYDTWLQMPTQSIYDNGAMNMYLQALAATAAQRKENYNHFVDLTLKAFGEKRWNYVIYYVNAALETQYFCGELYYMRGYANEQLGNLRAAKKDYKTAKKNHCPEAIQALEALKARKRNK